MIKVLKAGFYDTIQDLGRFDFQEYGVPISGVMDVYSAKIANALVGNDENAAVLEITLFGPKLEFQHDTLISISGANISPKLNSNPVSLNLSVLVKQGDVLSFGKLQYGCRAYLAVSGGFQTKKVMHSRSMYKNITETVRVQKNDMLALKEDSIILDKSSNASIKVAQAHFNDNVIEVFKGPEYECLNEKQKEQLEFQVFSVAKENSRMAYQLVEVLQNDLKPIITSLVFPGTVQLTPSGKLIILMRDCQTTGGYPRILQLKEASINKLSQKFTGNKINFKLVD